MFFNVRDFIFSALNVWKIYIILKLNRTDVSNRHFEKHNDQ